MSKTNYHTPEDSSEHTAEASDIQSGTVAQQTLTEYLIALKTIHATGAGVPETSYYPTLSNLFNAVGKTLKPKVRCIININNQGAGLPDGGLFTAEQFQRQADVSPKGGQLPARGAIEAKGTKPNVKAIATSKQVKGYLNKYGIVIVTNLREFLILERSTIGEPVEREAFALADGSSRNQIQPGLRKSIIGHSGGYAWREGSLPLLPQRA